MMRFVLCAVLLVMGCGPGQKLCCKKDFTGSTSCYCNFGCP